MMSTSLGCRPAASAAPRPCAPSTPSASDSSTTSRYLYLRQEGMICYHKNPSNGDVTKKKMMLFPAPSTPSASDSSTTSRYLCRHSHESSLRGC